MAALSKHFYSLRACVRAKLFQLCPSLFNPMNRSPWCSSVHGILQARILNWVAMPSSRGSSWSRDQPCISYACCIGRWVGSLLVVSPWNTFQYSCLENSMDRGAYWETDQGLQRIEHTWVANTFYGLVLVFSHRIGLGGSKIWDWGSLVARSV